MLPARGSAAQKQGVAFAVISSASGGGISVVARRALLASARARSASSSSSCRNICRPCVRPEDAMPRRDGRSAPLRLAVGAVIALLRLAANSGLRPIDASHLKPRTSPRQIPFRRSASVSPGAGQRMPLFFACENQLNSAIFAVPMCRKPDGEAHTATNLRHVTPSEKWMRGKNIMPQGGEAFGMFLSGPIVARSPGRIPSFRAGGNPGSIHPCANLTSLHWALSYLQKNGCSW